MERSGPLRRTPLTRTTPLVNRTPMARSRLRQRPPAETIERPEPAALARRARRGSPPPTWPAGVREAVMARDEHRCVPCGRRATQAHHRRPRGAGGTSAVVDASWGMAVCDRCHDAIESHREGALAAGWLLRAGYRDPYTVSIWVPAHGGVAGHWRWLDRSGGWSYSEERRVPELGALGRAISSPAG